MVKNGPRNLKSIDVEWQKFLFFGRWQEEKPEKPGVYPIMENDEFNRELRPERTITILSDGKMFGNTWIEEWGGYWWSEPMPNLPVGILKEKDQEYFIEDIHPIYKPHLRVMIYKQGEDGVFEQPPILIVKTEDGGHWKAKVDSPGIYQAAWREHDMLWFQQYTVKEK